jgi:hypothetical protein
VSALTVMAIALMATGAAGATIYLHWHKRAKAREDARTLADDDPYRSPWPLGLEEWLLSVGLPGVVGGVAIGALTWIIFALVLLALGVVG